MDKNILNKLRIKPDMRWTAWNTPPEFRGTKDEIPANKTGETAKADALLFFADSRTDLQKKLPGIISSISKDAVFWISYLKKGSGAPTDLNRDILWRVMKKQGYRAVSQVALDNKWSALRFKPEEQVVSKKFNTPLVDTTKRTVKIPKELKSAFTMNSETAHFFKSLSFTHKKEYVTWIESARKEETRKIRVKKTLEMLSKKQKGR